MNKLDFLIYFTRGGDLNEIAKAAKVELEQLYLDHAELEFRRKQFLEMDAEIASLKEDIRKSEDDMNLIIESDAQDRRKLRANLETTEKYADEWHKFGLVKINQNAANLESFMQLQAENKKLCDLLAERYETYLKVCAEVVRLESELDKERTCACDNPLPCVDNYSLCSQCKRVIKRSAP